MFKPIKGTITIVEWKNKEYELASSLSYTEFNSAKELLPNRHFAILVKDGIEGVKISELRFISSTDISIN